MKITKFAPHHPEALGSTLTLGSPAGGDLSGSLPGPTVIGLQGTPVSSTAPATGQILYFDGTSWTPVAIAREGTHAARPAAAAGNTGWLYHETDTNGELFISTGAAWDRVAAGSIALVASGLTGATAASRYAGATTSGAPASGTFAKGDFIIDQTGAIYICTTAGSPGTWTSAAGTFSLEVKEVDGAPDVTGVTVIQVSNGTLTDNGGGNVTISTGGGGGVTWQAPALKPGTPTDDFAGASLGGGWTAHSSGGSFGTGDCTTQGVEWLGSSLEMQFSGQMGAIYQTHGNTDLDFTVGGIEGHGIGPSGSSLMFGIAALDSSGTGVGVVIYNDGTAYIATITTWNYAANSDSWAGKGAPNPTGSAPSGQYWLRLKRVSGTWTGYVSMSGRTWDKTFNTRADSITVDRLAFGLFYNTAQTFSGRLTADYYQLDV